MRMAILVLPVLAWLMWQNSALAAVQTQQAKQSGSRLDELLLDPLDLDLYGDLLDDPTRRSRAKAVRSNATDRPAATARRKIPTDDRQFLDDLGEDIEWKNQRDPIVQIGDQMLTAARWISQNKTAQETQDIQQNILQALDVLIQQTRRGKKSRKPGTNSSQPMAGRDAGKQPGVPSPDARSDAQSHEQEKLREKMDQAAQSLDMDKMQTLIKEIWGHLPPTVREQMLKSYGERFLPEYEELIIEYFKRLAEDQEEGP